MKYPAFLLALISISFSACSDDSGKYDNTIRDLSEVRLTRFSSCAEMDEARKPIQSSTQSTSESDSLASTGVAPMSTDASENTANGETNVQVNGVDELDIVKADGELIYDVKTNPNVIKILRRSPAADAGVVSQNSLSFRANGLFITDDQLVAIGSESEYIEFESDPTALPPNTRTSVMAEDESMPFPRPGRYVERIILEFYKRNGDGTLTKKNQRKVDGRLVAARMIESQIFLVTEQYIGSVSIHNLEHEKTENLLPQTQWIADSENKVENLCKCQDIWVEKKATDPRRIGRVAVGSLMGVVGININKPEEELKSAFVAGDRGSIVYASHENLFLATSGWSQSTPIHQFSLDQDKGDVEYVGSALLEGYLLNQFSMDEHEDHLRVATTRWIDEVKEVDEEISVRIGSGTQISEVSVFALKNGDPQKVGQVSGMGKGERIYAVRFMGDKGYVVTFKKVDPLYTLDLSDPTSPQVRGELKIPGFSTYLHPMGDGYLLGIGKHTEMPEPDSTFAWFQGLQLSIFDVRDLDHPKELHKIQIGSRGTNSEALQDHKAFRFDSESGLLVIPVALFEGGTGLNDYGEHTFSGFHLYHASEKNGFEFVGDSKFEIASVGYGYNATGRSFINDGIISMLGGYQLVTRSVNAPDQDIARINID